ncbi:hypothetical protein JMA_21110 [Jeotgalibacillus malaysiensis]|uniref:Uncharacterized protein n=1 Tax=Jeotgalibacillus malaysiensis TaxID=1508404 RepID=A0A0B5AS96_9BACL|nr:YqhR family membrane protein [Jeotgalibacillus malaysiensis]AJD91428.1 hypothetical protein JMA_21110 [Jeotgalibacillus malaysiensis]
MNFPTIKRLPLAVYTSIAGAVVFYSFYRVYVFFHFIESDMLKPDIPFLAESFKRGWSIELIFFMLLLGASILWALIYYMLFKKHDTLYAGVFFSLIILWVIFLFAWLNEWRVNPADLKVRSIVSLHSLFILYGLFTGYSISYQEPYRKIQNIER